MKIGIQIMMKPPNHGRRFGIVMFDLIKVRVRNGMKAALEVQAEIERIIDSSAFLERAPFTWVTLSILYGLKFELAPRYERINKKYGDLPLAIEIDAQELPHASLYRVRSEFMRAALIALIHAGEKYALPTKALEQRKEQLDLKRRSDYN